MKYGDQYIIIFKKFILILIFMLFFLDTFSSVLPILKSTLKSITKNFIYYLKHSFIFIHSFPTRFTFSKN